ncbi:hypothetical protein [Flavobacterium sp. ZS1P14]|uniref:hypothetical protein n=1 Tax=Flavobacterium sp. ZS1P14 TaxID=3401729 RepID=UPI003AB0A54F
MKHTILFTGHMIDEKEREEPRFPASKEMVVRAEILKQLIKEKATTKKVLTGIAGGACGGDILFHELCEEIGIPTEMYLAFPVEEFKKRSVSFAGTAWDIRFDKLTKKLPIHILSVDRSNIAQNNIWAVANLWMLDHALQVEEKNMTLIALWDEKGGDGNGGTEHMINIAKDKGAKINIININEI